jgi:cell division protein ZapA
MDKIPLKIVIAGRTYPLTIKKEEEAVIKAAADRINSNIKKLQGSYAVKDMQDLLAMTTLQMAVQMNNESASSDSTTSQPDISEDIKKIIQKLDTAL